MTIQSFTSFLEDCLHYIENKFYIFSNYMKIWQRLIALWIWKLLEAISADMLFYDSPGETEERHKTLVDLACIPANILTVCYKVKISCNLHVKKQILNLRDNNTPKVRWELLCNSNGPSSQRAIPRILNYSRLNFTHFSNSS